MRKREPDGPSWQALWGEPDDARLLDAVWDVLGDHAASVGFDALPASWRDVLLSIRAQAMIDEGGLEFLLEHEDVILPDTGRAFAGVRFDAAANAMSRLMEVLEQAGGDPTSGVGERCQAFSATDPDAVGALEVVFDHGASAIASFVRSSPDVFESGPAAPPPGYEPAACVPPQPGVAGRVCAAWLEDLGAEVVLRHGRDRVPSGGARRVAGGRKKTESGEAVLRAVRLPPLHRELDTVIAALVETPASAMIEAVELPGARYPGRPAWAALASLPRLRRLDARGSVLDDQALAAFAGHGGLTDLDVTGCRVTDRGLRMLADVPLQRLRAIDSRIAAPDGWPDLLDFALGASRGRTEDLAIDPDLRFVEAMRALEGAALCRVPLAKRGVRRLSAVATLRELSLVDCEVEPVWLEAFADHPSLEALLLHGTDVSPRCAELLVELPALRRVEITGAELSRRVRRTLRGCEHLDLVE